MAGTIVARELRNKDISCAINQVVIKEQLNLTGQPSSLGAFHHFQHFCDKPTRHPNVAASKGISLYHKISEVILMDAKPKYNEDTWPNSHSLSLPMQEPNLDLSQFRPMLSMLDSLLICHTTTPTRMHTYKKGWETGLKLTLFSLLETQWISSWWECRTMHMRLFKIQGNAKGCNFLLPVLSTLY